MQRADTNQAVRVHRKVGASTTLNRRYVRRPQKGTEALEASVRQAAHAEAVRKAQRAQMGAVKKAQAKQEPPKVMRRAVQPSMAAGQVRRSPKISRFGNVSAAQAPAATSAAVQKRRTIKIEENKGREATRVATKPQARTGETRVAGTRAAEPAAAPVMPMAAAERVETPAEPVVMHPMQVAAMNRIQAQNEAAQRPKVSAQEIKNREIKKALAKTSKAIDKDVAERERCEKRTKLHFGIARVMLAISCTAAALVAIVYFVGVNMPDISMQVAAMQTGIRASYPGYVPRGFEVTDLSSESGKVQMSFVNDETGDEFTMVEEETSWDSSALETNYVKPEFKDQYSIVREQGLTIYMADKGAAWVNGGVMYKLTVKSGTLTKKQIKSIAVSL